MNHLEVLDTTLRDGAQTEGVAFSLPDKIAIYRELSELGIGLVEAGNPSSNPKDEELFKSLAHASDICAFVSTRKKEEKANENAALISAAALPCRYITVCGKASLAQADSVLHTTPQENLQMISDSIAFLKEKGKSIVFDAEHFFDGYRESPEYALSALESAAKAGADRLVLCDTNGGTDCESVYRITKHVAQTFPNQIIGIHAHNDMGLAVACTMAAVHAGAKHIQGTLIGIGERCGNANLSTVIGNLQLKENYLLLPQEKLVRLTQVCRKIADIANVTLPDSLPYVGKTAFAHKAGMHCDGVLKGSENFEHVSPLKIGNERQLLLSELSGKSAAAYRLQKLFKESFSEEQLKLICKQVKEAELRGYTFESADASLFVLAEKILKRYEPSFHLIGYKVLNEQPASLGMAATATVKISVNGETSLASAEGEGPVHALDLALRKALQKFYPEISEVTLSDYKVRVLDSKSATAAIVRVLITSTDSKEIWTTVGVSSDIIEASFNALSDSIAYKLRFRQLVRASDNK